MFSDTEEGGEDVMGVPIGREQLFEVDVRSMMVILQSHLILLIHDG